MKMYGTYEYDEAFASQINNALNNSYSDKGSFHGYHTVYAHILKNRPILSFLEVGLFLNELPHSDIYAWAEILPSAKIYGADIKQSQLFNTDRISTYYVDQCNQDSLANLVAEIDADFDFVLDDASHFFACTIKTFEALFPRVSAGGVYLIEDIIDSGFGANEWQQNIHDLESYLDSGNYSYEVFQSKQPIPVIDPESGEPTGQNYASDDYIICIYK